MSSQGHPILVEISVQLPESARCYRYIREGGEFQAIHDQAQLDIACLENFGGTLSDGRDAKTVLAENGFREWLEDSDQDERLRVLGALKLIVDVAEDLADD